MYTKFAQRNNEKHEKSIPSHASSSDSEDGGIRSKKLLLQPHLQRKPDLLGPWELYRGQWESLGMRIYR